MSASRAPRFSNRLIALLIGLATLLLLTATASDIGLTWDEPAYITASESYMGWLKELVTHPAQALQTPQIDQYWSPNHEHPPVDKIWSGLVWSAARCLFDDLTAHRLGNMLLVSAMTALLYLWLSEVYGRVAGLAGAAALLALPRFFFHAHLAALDVPAAFVVLCLSFVFWKVSDKPGWKWTLLLGLTWGIALATKVNAVFVPPILFLWVLIFRRSWPLILRTFVMTLIGLPFLVLLWPWMYHDTLQRLTDYLLFVTIAHWQIGTWYFSRFYMPPPWHYPFVIALAVTPLTVLLGSAAGVIRASLRRKDDQALGWLFILSALAPLLALASGKSMVYDGERLFMPFFPFIAALAGMGFAWAVESIRRIAKQRSKPALAVLLSAILAIAVFLPPTASAARLYPHLLSYYSETVGCLPGATRLGLETTYWCETYASALPYLNAHAKADDTVWVEPWSHDVMIYYQLHGMLTTDLHIYTTPGSDSVFGSQASFWPNISYQTADFVVFQYRQSYFGAYTEPDPITPAWLGAHQPVYQVTRQGVPLMQIFSREK